MTVLDNRKNNLLWFDVRDESRFHIGDVVETHQGDVCLVVWSDKSGRPYGQNPGYNGLVSLKTGDVYTIVEHFPKVRLVNAVVEVLDDRA